MGVVVAPGAGAAETKVPESCSNFNGYFNISEPKPAIVLASAVAVPAPMITSWPMKKPSMLPIGITLSPAATGAVLGTDGPGVVAAGAGAAVVGAGVVAAVVAAAVVAAGAGAAGAALHHLPWHLADNTGQVVPMGAQYLHGLPFAITSRTYWKSISGTQWNQCINP